MIRYYITDRARCGGIDGLVKNIATQMAAGIEMVQIRERDLSARELFDLVTAVTGLPNPHGSRILVNDRTDVAMASGADGVHLRSHAVSPSRLRSITPTGFVIGVSCHSVDDVKRAADEGASFAVLAPIFPTPGKGPAIGLGPLTEAAKAATIPVLALGGVDEGRIQSCLDAGAAGVAGISLYSYLAG